MEPAELAIIFAAIALGAFIKGVTGSGLPQIAIPVMAGLLGVERAVVIMAIPGLVSNGWLLWRHRSNLHAARDLPVLLVTGTVGAILGTWLLKSLPPRPLSAILGSFVLVYITMRITHPTLELRPEVTRVLSPPVGFAAGTLQGATGMSGPLLTTYLHGYRHPAPVFVVSLVTLFQVFGAVQAITMVQVGLFTRSRVLEGLLALVPMALLLPVGVWFGRRMPARYFDVWILLLLLGSASKLLYDAVTG